MSILLLRVAAMVVILTAPFFLLAFSEGKAEGAIWLMIPFILMIPTLLIAVFLLAPFEALTAKMGLNPNLWVPIFGAGIGALVAAVALKLSKDPDRISKVLHGDPHLLAALFGTILAGAFVAGTWRLSLWLLKYLRWA